MPVDPTIAAAISAGNPTSPNAGLGGPATPAAGAAQPQPRKKAPRRSARQRYSKKTVVYA